MCVVTVLYLFCFCLHVCARGVQKRELGLLERELQAVVNCLWVLGIEPWSSGRATSALNHGVISPACLIDFYSYCRPCGLLYPIRRISLKDYVSLQLGLWNGRTAGHLSGSCSVFVFSLSVFELIHRTLLK